MALVAGCTADLGGTKDGFGPPASTGAGPSVSEGTGGLGSGASPGTGGGPPGECAPRFPRDLVLLGEFPFVNSLRTLFGTGPVEGRLAPGAETKSFSQKGIVANTSLVNTRFDWAKHVTSNLEGQEEAFSGCTSGDTTCVRAFLEKFAHDAFSRPVVAEEVHGLMTVFEQGSQTSFGNGIRLALQAVLVSPSFNHRTEYGAPRADGTFELTPHEYATTLSFLLTDSIPDQELLTAADNGSLTTPEGRAIQVNRMLQQDSTKESVESTLLAAWTLGNLFGKVKDPGLFPEFNANLASQMYEETRLFLRRHLWEGHVAGVLSSRTTFVNQALADLYGVPFPGTDPSSFVEVELPADTRAGLLTQASFLTTLSRTDQTSVVARGLFVNGPLLCFPKIPSPPEAAVAAIEEQLESGASEKEMAEFRASTAPCNNCHDHFDAYGLLLETYDPIGRYRTTHEGLPIDSSVDLTKMRGFDGVYESAIVFAEEIAERPEFVQCVTRHLMSYGTGENGLGRDDCEVTDITRELSAQSTMSEIVAAVVSSSAFSTRIPEN